MTTPVKNTPAGPGGKAVALAVSTVIFALGPDLGTGVRSLRIPLVRRIRQPYEGQWALPGGPLHADDDLEEAARRNLHDTTALTPRYLEQLYAFGTVDRSPAGPTPADRVVSIVYWALVQSSEAAVAAESDNVRWFDADTVPALAFDHNTIVDYALWRLRTKLEYSRIAHAFLGETFTLSELREVHEAVLGRALDPANFRRMIDTSDTVIPTDQYLTGTSHRPPRLYRYNPDVALVDRGPLAQS